MNKIKPFVSAGLLFLVLCTIIGIAACVSHDLPVLDTPLWFIAVVAMSYTVFSITARFYGWLKKDKPTMESIAGSEVTYGQIYLQFLDSTKIDKSTIVDYRPCNTIYNTPYIPMSIVVWLSNGERIIYTYSYRKGNENEKL